MMPEAKHISFTVVLSSVLMLSGCSSTAFDFIKVDGVDDTVDYQNTAKAVRALSIPPGLSNPQYDSTYAAARLPGSSAQSSAATPQTQVAAPAATASRGSSLGSALLAQSEADGASSGQTSLAPARIQLPVTPVVQAAPLPQVAMTRLKGGEPALAINAPAATAWNVLLPLLPSAGFRIDKQQPDQRIITATYQGAAKANLKTGQTHLILLAENASEQSFIGVADSNGKPASETIAQAVIAPIKAAFEK